MSSKHEFHEGDIVEIRNPNNGKYYDGVLWRILQEDATNASLFIRFVDSID